MWLRHSAQLLKNDEDYCIRSHSIVWHGYHNLHHIHVMWDLNLLAFLTVWCRTTQTHIYLAKHRHAHKRHSIDKQVQTLIIMRAGVLLEHDASFPHSRAEMPPYIIFFSHLVRRNFILSLCCFRCLSCQSDINARAIVLSWSRLYWLSNVELIKGNLRGVSVPMWEIKWCRAIGL